VLAIVARQTVSDWTAARFPPPYATDPDDPLLLADSIDLSTHGLTTKPAVTSKKTLLNKSGGKGGAT
jgi:hypothetical protein